jgi:hypothetical protein
MNFVDAAVALLREAEAPLHVEELCRLALERGLLDSPGANPLRSFKGRLTTELKRGDESRVMRVEDDVWWLSDAGRDGAAPEAPAAEVAEEEDLEPAAADEDSISVADEADEPDLLEEDDEELDEGEEPDQAEAEPARHLTAEEAELAAVYGDEVGTAQVGALSEYRDAQTADEDRPMVPEMTGERRGRREREDWKTRRERIRRERREKREAREKEREARQGNNGAAAAVTAAPRESAVPPPPEVATHAEPAAGGPADLARRACEVLASVKGGQPVWTR